VAQSHSARQFVQTQLPKPRRRRGHAAVAAAAVASLGAGGAFADIYNASVNVSKATLVGLTSQPSSSTRIAVEGDTSGGASFEDYAILDFNFNSINVPDYKIVTGINGNTLTLNLVDRAPLDGFATAGTIDFYLTKNNATATNYRYTTFSDNGGTGTNFTDLQLASSYAYTPGAASGTLNPVTLNLGAAGSTFNTYVNTQVTNGGSLRLVLSPHSGTVSANWEGTSGSTNPVLAPPTLNADFVLTDAPTNNAVINFNSTGTKSLAGPIVINRLYAFGTATNSVTLANGGSNAANFRYIPNGSVSGSGSTITGNGTTNVTLSLSGSGFTPGAPTLASPGTASIAIHNRLNQNDTTDAVVNYQVNSVVTSRFIDNVGNSAIDFGYRLVGTPVTQNVTLDTENANIVGGNGSNSLTIVTLAGTTAISGNASLIGGSNATRAILTMASNGISQTFSNGTEQTTRSVTFTPLIGGAYAVNNLNIGNVSFGLSFGPGETAVGIGTTPTSGRITAGGTFYEKALLTASGSTTGSLTLSNASATANIFGTNPDIGLRADARVAAAGPVANFQNGWNVTNQFAAGAVIAAGSNVTAIASFNTTGKLNGTYGGTLAVPLEHVDQSSDGHTIIGTAPNDLPSKTFTLSTAVTGNSGNGSANILPGGTYGSVAAPYYINRGIGVGMNSTVSFLGGVASANNTVAVAFGTSAAPRAASDNAAITGTGGDLYVAQMSYDPTITDNAPALGWHNGTNYVSASFGNTDSGASANEINGSYAASNLALGNYGIDTTNHVVWAVVNHTGTFAAYKRLPGDTTFKGSVTLSDYNTLAANFKKTGQTWSQGDFTNDGQVTLADYNILAANFHTIDGASGAVASASTSSSPAIRTAVTLTGRGLAGPAANPAFVDPGAGKVALEADPATGKLYIVGHDAHINSYEVDSATGKLTNATGRGAVSNYNTVAAQSANGVPGSALGVNEPFWNVISQSAGFYMAEGVTTGQSATFDVIGNGLQAFDLNVAGASAWTGGTALSDLSFQYGNGTGATLFPAVISLGTAVPEPTVMSLVGVGAIGLLARRRKSRSARAAG
jgi:hypothetical protein